MIVPRSRLLFWTASITLPAALIAAAAPEVAPICLLLIAGLGTAAIVDAVSANRSLTDIGIELPPISRMSKDRESKLEVRIKNPSQRQRYLRIALGLPKPVRANPEEQELLLPSGSTWSQVLWTCLAGRRGNYQVQLAFVEGVSPLGLWAVRRRLPVQSEIRVYPNLLSERKNLASLFLNRGRIGTQARRQVGRGRDFEKLREYAPGDGFDEIHWKATARRGRPVTKVFQIERTQEIYVAIDASRLSSRRMSEAADAILERLVTSALVLGLAAEKQGDLFGLLTFSDRVESFIRARNGKTHYSHCRDVLYTLQPKLLTPDFDDVCSFIRLRLRRRALIVFLTSLDDPALAESFVRNIGLIGRQHLVLVNVIRQSGTTPLFSGPEPEAVDDLYPRLAGHLQWSRLRQLEKTLQRHGVGFSQLDNERFSADVVSQYLVVKQRQIL